MVYGILLSIVAKSMVLNKYAIRQKGGDKEVEILTTSVWALLIVLGIILAVCLLCYIAGKTKYKVHISGTKIEVLPAEELPKQNTDEG